MGDLENDKKARAKELAGLVDVSRESFERLWAYSQLLLSWQRRINLIGESTMAGLWTRHIADSLQLVPFLPRETRRIIDFGSGAGFPGLAIALMTSDDWALEDIHLIESNHKKCAFLREAGRLAPIRVNVHPKRIEEMDVAALAGSHSVITSRAMAPLTTLLDYARPALSKGSLCVFHKGQDVDSELTETTKCWKVKIDSHGSKTDPNGTILVIRDPSNTQG